MTDRTKQGELIKFDYEKYLGSTKFWNWLAAHVDRDLLHSTEGRGDHKPHKP